MNAPAPASERTGAAGAPPPPSGARLALFRLGGRLCGVPAAFCKQFVHLDAVTPVPLAPAHLLGVTQLRGRILPVLDPGPLLGLGPSLPPRPASPTPRREAGGATGDPIIPPAAASAIPIAPPAAASGMPALVVTATGLDSALAALRVSEIVGFERPEADPPGTAAGAEAGATGTRALWQGEEVAVLDVAALLARLRPGPAPRQA